jgi:hypothetical protein
MCLSESGIVLWQGRSFPCSCKAGFDPFYWLESVLFLSHRLVLSLGHGCVNGDGEHVILLSVDSFVIRRSNIWNTWRRLLSRDAGLWSRYKSWLGFCFHFLLCKRWIYYSYEKKVTGMLHIIWWLEGQIVAKTIGNLMIFILSMLIVCVCVCVYGSTRVWTQGLALTRQALYHLNHSPCLPFWFLFAYLF